MAAARNSPTRRTMPARSIICGAWCATRRSWRRRHANRERAMSKAVGIREVAWLDCAGGGQVVVDGNYAYIGHIDAPNGTTIVDVSDPRHPRIVFEIAVPPGFHSHKVRAANDVMVVNREHHGRSADGKHPGRGGLVIYDNRDPRAPRELTHWQCDGSGVHRFTFDGRYAYI